MIKKNEIEEINKINDSISIQNFLKNSKELYEELIPLYNKNNSSKNHSIIFKYLSHIQFGLYILPYLSLKDILFLRVSNKEINLLVNSKICCINYYIKTLKKHISFTDNTNITQKKRKFNSQLKPFHELTDEAQFIEQKNILNKIKEYIKSPDFSLEYLTQIYRVEMDYLKYEENHQERYMNSLIETQKKINEEYQLIKDKSKKREESWVNVSREENSEKSKIIENNLKEWNDEELKKKIQELKIKKENILFKLNYARKTNEEINLKNDEKKKIINKLKYLVNDDNEENNKNIKDNDDLEAVNEFLKGC